MSSFFTMPVATEPSELMSFHLSLQLISEVGDNVRQDASLLQHNRATDEETLMAFELQVMTLRKQLLAYLNRRAVRLKNQSECK